MSEHEYFRRAEVERLLSSYALLIDSQHIDDALQLFTEDCELVFMGVPARGREAVRYVFESAIARGRVGIHLPGPTLVDIESDGMSARTHQSFIFVPNGSNSLLRGMYRDRVVRQDDAWRFQLRDIELFPGAD
jgi:SnoaL-like domain